MAEVDVQSSGGKGAKKSSLKKTSTKVDMTPMVDLAFLLITFFMLTTTMQKPQTMEITMPDKQKGEKQEKMKVKESRSITVLLGDNDKVYWYQGTLAENPTPEVTDYSANGIRKALMTKKRQIGKIKNAKTGELEDAIIVLIKPKDTSRYKNMVDILDEMNIVGVNTYAIVEMTPEDLALMAKATSTPAAPAPAS